jgi:hypothetical protein
MLEIPPKVDGSQYTANEYTNGLSQENQNTVLNSGQLLTASNQHQQTQAISRFGSSATHYLLNTVDSTANNLRVFNGSGLLNSTISAYFNGLTVDVLLVLDNNPAAVTLNVNGLGAIPVVMPDGSPISTIVLFAGTYNRFVFLDSVFQWVPFNAYDNNFRREIASQTAGSEGSTLIGTTGQTLQEKLDSIISPVAGGRTLNQRTFALANSFGVTDSDFVTVQSGPNRWLRLTLPTGLVSKQSIITVTPYTYTAGGSEYDITALAQRTNAVIPEVYEIRFWEGNAEKFNLQPFQFTIY